MGLQVWLPLNGNIDNQGLTPVTLSVGSPTYTSGKIGQCLNTTLAFNVSNNLITNLGNTNTYSMCCWCKNLNASASGRWVFSISSGTGTTRGLWENNSSTSRHWAYAGTGVSLSTSINTIDGNWHHICFTSAGSVVKLYVDGIYQSQITSANTTAMTTNIITLNANNYNLNDFRLYDTVLSPREVKEISKGLVLHYPLSMPGQENLVTGSNTNSTSTNKWLGHSAVGGNTSTIEVDETGTNCVKVTRDSTAQSSWDYLSYDALLYNQLKTSTIYTVSFEAKPSVNGEITLIGFRRGDATNTMTASVVQVQSSLIANKWNRCVYRCTTLSSFDGITIGGQVVYLSRSTSLKGVNTTVLFKNIKVEEGEIATHWLPNPADTAYSTLGFNDGIEYDVSGYNHNGKRVGNITYDADTPRYETSAVFDYTHVINDVSTVHLSNEFTISWWGKINTWRKVWEGMFLLQNTTALNSASGTYSIGSAIHASTVSAMTLTLRQGGTSYPFDHYNWTYTVGTWAHYACTYKNGVIIMYQNGAQVYTATIDNSSSGDYYYTIGKRVNNCICQLSDFRIYNTALSADDILELYHTPETLSHNGTLLTQCEFVES